MEGEPHIQSSASQYQEIPGSRLLEGTKKTPKRLISIQNPQRAENEGEHAIQDADLSRDVVVISV